MGKMLDLRRGLGGVLVALQVWVAAPLAAGERGEPEAGGERTRLRVAMAGIASEDLRGREAGVLENAGMTLQALLETESGFDWVERRELDEGVRELALSVGGHLSPGEAVQVGRWLQADILVRGILETGGERLDFEFIDLQSADLLAEVSLPPPERHPGFLQVSRNYLQEAAEVLRRSLEEVAGNLGERRGRTTLAPLYFANLGAGARLGYFEEMIRGELTAAAEGSDALHVLTFPRPLQAAPETELVLGGLVDADSWFSVADLYLWGSFRELEVEDPEIAFSRIPVEIEIYLWDGTRSPVRRVRRARVGELESVAAELAEETVRRAERRESVPEPPETVRRETAASLLEQARELAGNIRRLGSRDFLHTEVGREFFVYQLKLLQTAAFFDPLNRQIRKELLETTWSGANPFGPLATPEDYGRRFRDYRKFAERFPYREDGSADHPMRFEVLDKLRDAVVSVRSLDRNERRRTAALYDRFLDAFGREAAGVNRWAAEEGYSDEAWVAEYNRQVFNMYFGLEEFRMGFSWGSAGPGVRMRALERIWPYISPYVYDLRDSSPESEAFEWIARDMLSLYARFGAGHEAIKILAEPASAGGALPSDPEPARREFNRVEVVPSDWDGTVGNEGAFRQLPYGPELAAGVREVAFRPDIRPPASRQGVSGGQSSGRFRIHHLQFRAGRLWISETAKSFGRYPDHRNPRGNHYVWAYDPLLRNADNFTEVLSEHPRILDLVHDNGRIWAAVAGNGVWNLDFTGGNLEKLVLDEGLQSPMVRALAKDGDNLYMGGGARGGAPVLSRYNLSSGEWYDIPFSNPPESPGGGRLSFSRLGTVTHLVPGERGLLVGLERGTFFFDPEKGAWESPLFGYSEAFAESIRGDPDRERRAALLSERYLRPGPDGGIEDMPRSALSQDKNGFWIGNPYGLYFVNPDAGAETAFYEPVGHVTAMAHQGNHLWVAVNAPIGRESDAEDSGGGSYLLLFDMLSRKWQGYIRIPDTYVGHLAAVPGVLWAASDRLFEIRLREVLSVDPGELSGNEGVWPVGSGGREYPLHRAVFRGDLKELDSRLQAGVPADERLPDGRSPLHLAAEAGNRDAARLLLEPGADPDATSRDGRFPLLIAARRGDRQLAAILLEYGANIDHRPASRLLIPDTFDMKYYTSNRDPYLFAEIEPSQPEGLTAEVLSTNAVRLTWENRADNASRIHVLRRPDESHPFSLEAVLPPDAIEYVDINFSYHKDRPAEFGYAVEAINGSNYDGPRRADGTRHPAPPSVSAVLPEREPSHPDPHWTESRVRNFLRLSEWGREESSESRTALMAASAGGRIEMVRALLARSPALDARDIYGNTAFLLAAQAGHRDVMRLLLEHGADPDVRNVFGETALVYEYERRDDLAFFEYLLDNGADIDRGGRWTLLMRAARAGRPGDIERFLDRGADPNLADRGGHTAFSLAYSRGYHEISDRLMERGFDPTLPYWSVHRIGYLGDAPMRRAIERGDEGMVNRLLASGFDPNRILDGTPLLILAVQENRPETVRTLLARGADPGAKTDEGYGIDAFITGEAVRAVLAESGTTIQRAVPLPTSLNGTIRGELPGETADPSPREERLLEAAADGDAVAVERLLEEGIDPDARDERGWTALVAALSEGHGDVARALVDAGAEINLITDHGSSPLGFAVATNDPDLVAHLLDRGADPNLARRESPTPLFASVAGNPEITRLLLAHGALPGLFIPIEGPHTSPLIGAARRGNGEAVRLLLDHGARVDARVMWDWPATYTVGDPIPGDRTAFVAAGCSGDVEILELLIARGADPHYHTTNGQNALLWAAHCGDLSAVEFLLGLGLRHEDAAETAREQGHREIAERLQSGE